jgi:hypothetical protein
MAYCPQCLTEYVEGTAECADCRVPLAAGPAPPRMGEGEPEEQLVTVRTFRGPTSQMEADLACNILETQGIDCAVRGETSAEILPGVEVVQLLVRQEDAEHADEILTGYLESGPIEPTGVEPGPDETQ